MYPVKVENNENQDGKHSLLTNAAFCCNALPLMIAQSCQEISDILAVLKID